MRRTGRTIGTLAAATSLAMIGGGLAFADQLAGDADALAGNQSTATVNATPGQSVTLKAGFELRCHGSQHVQRGASVTMAISETKLDGVVVSNPMLPQTTIGPIPATWPTDSTNNNCPTGQSALAPLSSAMQDIAYTAPNTAGTYSLALKFAATSNGVGDNPSAFTGGGNTVTLTYSIVVSPPPDTTKPTASASATQATAPVSSYASGSWTNKDVTVSLTGSDNDGGSGLKELRYSTTGVASATSGLYNATEKIAVSAETTTTVSYVAIDHAGNVSDPQSFVVKIDKAAPTVTPDDVAPSGWRATNVTQSFTASDPGGSGLAAGSPASFTLTASAESADGGAARTEDSQTITDLAGNSVTRKVSGLIDKSAPSISGQDESLTTWTNQDVTRNYTAEDRKSGLAASTDSSFALKASAESTKVNGNIVATKVEKDVLDQLGNTATRVLEALIDKTKPALSGAATTSPNGVGWYKGDVTIAWTGSDPLSGIDATTQPGNSTVAGEGSNLGIAAVDGPTIKDNAGNTSDAASVSGIKIDRTPPTSQVQGVTEGAVYWTAPTVTCAASDSLSLVKTHGTPSGNTSSPGQKTVTCNGATDNADNTQTVASQSVTYTVVAMDSFSKNFDGQSVPKAKAGSALPLGWAFTDGTSRVQPITRVAITSASLSSCTDESGTAGTEVAEVAAGGSGLQLLTDGSYQVNWKSSTTTGCRRVTVKMYTGPNESDLFASRSVAVNFTK